MQTSGESYHPIRSAMATRGCLQALLLLVIASLSASTFSQLPTRIIGNVGGQLGRDSDQAHLPFTRYLQEQIPAYQFTVESFSSIKEMIDAVDQGKLDFAMVTPVAFVELNSRHEVRPIATVTQQFGGREYPWLAGAAFTLAARLDLQNLSDAKGKVVAALSPLALGGWLSVVREWRAGGLDPEQDLGRLKFDFSYQNIIADVCSGQADIGVLSAGMLASYLAICDKPLRVLSNTLLTPDPRYPVNASTRLYPEVAFVAIGANIEESLVNAMAQALLAVEPGSEVARAATVSGFTPALSYDPVTDLMQELRLGPYENFGRFTVLEFMEQHAGKVILSMAAIMALLGIAFARSKILNFRLSKSEQFRRLVFEGSQLPVVIIDRKNLQIIDLNKAALNIYGFRDQADIIGKLPGEVSAKSQLNGRDSQFELWRITQGLVEGQTMVFEWLHERPDGTQWEAEVHLLCFRNDKTDLLQATLVDVTERNRTRQEHERIEQQLRHAQRLESLGRLSGAIAHDFNNLLTVINGYGEFLLLDKNLDSKTIKVLREITQAGWQARDLTNQLLTFSRKQIARMVPLDLNAKILEGINIYRSLLGERVQLTTSFDPSIGLILADSNLLNQVVMNLLINAKDAMPEGGVCKIRTAKVWLNEEVATAKNLQTGEYVLLSVSDNGTGMSEAIQEHIFEPFFSTKGDKGNGIGLATAYGIIRQCGGNIYFDSVLQVGTTFYLYLPVTREKPRLERHEDAVLPLDAESSRTILVVEDQPDVRLFACTLLRSAGYQVLEAEGGEQALVLASQQAEPVDLLFSDLVMPGMNGRELAEKFVVKWPTTRILFTSGYANDEVALEGVNYKKFDLISKPYTPKNLLRRIREVLAQEAAPMNGNAES